MLVCIKTLLWAGHPVKSAHTSVQPALRTTLPGMHSPFLRTWGVQSPVSQLQLSRGVSVPYTKPPPSRTLKCQARRWWAQVVEGLECAGLRTLRADINSVILTMTK